MKKYYLGLDIGTNSIGWAVVDEENQIVKKNGKALWGVRMFEESMDSKDRRAHRSGRRRNDRRHDRIMNLRDLFYDEINKVDKTFFERIDDSFFKIEDKRNKNKHNLFVGDYTDKDFNKEYPTIYHLRDYLYKEENKVDIRFLYIALSHMVKFRGNFLTPGENFNQSDNSRIREIFENFNEVCTSLAVEYEDYEDYYSRIEFNDSFFDNFKEIMLAKKSKTDKKKLLKELFNVDNKTLANELLIPLIIGSKCNISSLTSVKENKYEKCEITVVGDEIESLIDEKRTIIPELQIVFDFIPQIKDIVDHYFVINLLQNSKTLSEAMIKIYDDHNSDLRKLKKFIRKYLPDKYEECFRKYDDKLNNYPKYVGFNKPGKKAKRFAHCKREDFYSYLSSLFKQVKNDAKEEIEYFTSKIENTNLLLRQNSDQNGSIPMQLNLMEMKKILSNQSKHYPFLNNMDENGITVSDKIISIFKFVIPYYVGPLNNASKNSWVVRTDEKIKPWNFNKVVNLDETAKIFIERMQNKCTYLKGDHDFCMPKNSLYFSEYNCLSYINKVTINGAVLPIKIKQELFENVFLKIKKPTKKHIYDYLRANYGDLEVTTTHKKELPEVNCDMSSYIKFKEIFKDRFEENIELIEQIIKDIVIFTDKKILEKRLYDVYGLDKEIVKQIKDLNYKDYSSISSKLITGINISNPITGEYYGTVLDIMKNTHLNLQQILYADEYRLIDVIENYNKENQTINSENLEDFIEENVFVTSNMKRPLIQSYKLIEEIESILKCNIDRFFIECTRTNKEEKNKPSVSRYNKLKDLYKNCKTLANEFNIDLALLNKQLDDNKDKLRSDIIYLYFTQLGRCAYTLEKIDFDDLFNNILYDVDHIYPQSLIKDDSLSNRVLVSKKKNNLKQDLFIFEIENFLPKDAYKFYTKLLDLELISKEKYRRLTEKEVNMSVLEGFVNRQIVATNQAVKGLITVLKTFKNVPQSNIIYSKSENISSFRQKYDCPKSRIANNFHHAHDAYLNVVIGKVINDYYVANHFSSSKDYFRMKVENKTINPDTILKYNRYIHGKLIWDKDNMIKLIKKNLYERFDVNETIRTYNPTEMYKKVTIRPAGSKDLVPVSKTDCRVDITKYGGIESNSYSRNVIIKTINKKGNEEYILESIPKIYDNKINTYLEEQGYSDYTIEHNNIKTNVVVEHNGLKYAITGKSGLQYVIKNLYERFFSYDMIKIIKKVEKYFDNIKLKMEMPIINDYIIVAPARKNYNEIILSHSEIVELYNNIKVKFTNKKYGYSNIESINTSLNEFDINELKITDVLYIVNELLKLLKTNERKLADLKMVGLSSNSGALCLNKKLKPGMKFIHESITGYYRKVLFEVPK